MGFARAYAAKHQCLPTGFWKKPLMEAAKSISGCIHPQRKRQGRAGGMRHPNSWKHAFFCLLARIVSFDCTLLEISRSACTRQRGPTVAFFRLMIFENIYYILTFPRK
jgi:hypothetical protein